MKPSLRTKLDSLAKRLEELNRLLSAENAARDMGEFRKLSREHSELSGIAGLYGRYQQAERDAAAAGEMASDPSMKGFADEELKAAQARMQGRESVPLIRALRDQAEDARRSEVERALRLLARGDDPKQVLETLSQGLTNKLLHAPTQALNEASGEERRTLATTLARLFRLGR